MRLFVSEYEGSGLFVRLFSFHSFANIRVDENYVARLFAITFASCSLCYANSKITSKYFGSDTSNYFDVIARVARTA